MKAELKINVEVVGRTASGKSTVIYLMKEFLREKGFDLEFDGGDDYNNESEFNQVIEREIIHGEFNKRIQAVSEKSKLVISEVQAKIK